MKTQTFLSLAIIATFTFGAYADPHVGPIGNHEPSADGSFPSNIPMATDYPLYESVTVNNDDKNHIASTAYVKGAHNDTIAALNGTAMIMAGYNQRIRDIENQMSQKLIDSNGNTISTATVVNDVSYMTPDGNLVSAEALRRSIRSDIGVTVYTHWGTDYTRDVTTKLLDVMPQQDI